MRPSPAIVSIGVGLALVVSNVAFAGELAGNVRATAGRTETEDTETDVLDRDFSLSWQQAITPWLALLVGYRDTRLETDSDTGTSIERTSREPRVDLNYRHPYFAARLSASRRTTEGTTPADDFETEFVNGIATWTPRDGPVMSVRFRSDTNTSDVSVFGRDIETRSVDLDVAWDYATWGVSVNAADYRLENASNGFSLDQRSAEVRYRTTHTFSEGAVRLSTTGFVRYVDQLDESASGATFGRVQEADRGLFAVDTSPEFGELDEVPGLIDGDVADPTFPPIDVGGASTFRNVGVDLGVTLPVDRLEVSVDSPSSSAVIWEVWSSSDNLNWTRVDGVLTRFDIALLRYEITFPRVTDRYFKVVNVSPNALVGIFVTELRALVDIDRLTRRDRESLLYRLDVRATARPNDRIVATVAAGFDDDRNTVEGVATRDDREIYYNAGLIADLADDVELRVDYRFADSEEDVTPLVRRRTESLSSAVEWTPLETVRAGVLVSKRTEDEAGRRLRTTDTVRSYARTEVWPTLDLVTEVIWSDVDDPFSGFTLESVRVSESVDAQPLPRWRFGGGVRATWYQSTGAIDLDRRVGVFVSTALSITPYLTLSGNLSYDDTDFQENVAQRWSLSWSPGPKLSVSAAFQDSATFDSVRTTGVFGGVSYRAGRRLILFANASDTEVENLGTTTRSVESVSGGLRFSF